MPSSHGTGSVTSRTSRSLIPTFDPVAFEAELAGLPGKYAPPRGQLLHATVADQPAGCVALREIDGTCCEMKRMFVYPERQGYGIGRALADAVIRDARALGYQRMLLDTSIRQAEAQALYRRLGFRDVVAVLRPPRGAPELAGLHGATIAGVGPRSVPKRVRVSRSGRSGRGLGGRLGTSPRRVRSSLTRGCSRLAAPSHGRRRCHEGNAPDHFITGSV